MFSWWIIHLMTIRRGRELSWISVIKDHKYVYKIFRMIPNDRPVRFASFLNTRNINRLSRDANKAKKLFISISIWFCLHMNLFDIERRLKFLYFKVNLSQFTQWGENEQRIEQANHSRMETQHCDRAVSPTKIHDRRLLRRFSFFSKCIKNR